MVAILEGPWENVVHQIHSTRTVKVGIVQVFGQNTCVESAHTKQEQSTNPRRSILLFADILISFII